MKINKSKIKGCYLIEPNLFKDNRGVFFRSFCKTELNKKTKLNFSIIQESIAINTKKNTVRGLHMQNMKVGETKIVRVLEGSIMDVVVDLRHKSKTYLQYISVILSKKKNNAILIPPGCAHGYITLTTNSLIHYSMNKEYSGNTIKINYLDKKLNIKWPKKKIIISCEDKNAQEWSKKN